MKERENENGIFLLCGKLKFINLDLIQEKKIVGAVVHVREHAIGNESDLGTIFYSSFRENATAM